MNVPFISSGAISRAHYSLVRELEYATSIRSANQHLSMQVEAIRRQLADSNFSLGESKKCLIILLYCYMNISNDYTQPDALHFALPHAITLAEAGRTIGEKRIGYLFCAEVMPANHELQLMLINTLRKDLERDHMPSICLALENILGSSNEDLVPAIQYRLQQLLSHNSPHVRRRALLAFRSLAVQHPGLSVRINSDALRLLRDPLPSVSNAALVLSSCFIKIEEHGSSMQSMVNKLLEENSFPNNKEISTTRLLSTLLDVGLSESNIANIVEIIQLASNSDRVVLRGAFQLLSGITALKLLTSISPGSGSPIENIRHILASRDPNDIYLFLTCLECLDPALWAGTTSEFPAILDEWEVKRIMQLLDSSDILIRRKTLKLLNLVDSNIVAQYYSQAVDHIVPNLSTRDTEEYAVRLIEVIETQSGPDGEVYARELKSLLVRFEQHFPNFIMERAVTMVLYYFRQAGTIFRIGFSTVMLAFLIESDSALPQTLMILIAALSAEQCGRLSLSPIDIIQGLSSKLFSCTPSVQDACLLAMLRVAAECTEVPYAVRETVTQLEKSSRRHVRQRCEQFTAFVNNRPALLEVVRRAKSSSLPDFLTALLDQHTYLVPGVSPKLSSSNQTLSASGLRYDAYDAPKPTPKRRARELFRSPSSIGSSHSETISEGGRSLSRLGSSLSTRSSMDRLSKTMTPGELTLAAGRRELEREAVAIGEPGADLIALDSPFVEVSDYDQEVGFESYWETLDKCDIRGWYDGSVDSVVGKLQEKGHIRVRVIVADIPPFIGELKVVVLSGDEEVRGVLRLRETEGEESCLWRMRCRDAEFGAEMNKLLT